MKKSLVPCALALLLANGCSHGATPPTTPAAVQAALTDVHLLAEGAEPRHVYRYDTSAGRSERFVIDVETLAAATATTGEAALAGMHVQFEVSTGPTESLPGGGFRSPIAIESVGFMVPGRSMQPDELARLSAEFSPLLGIRGTVDLDDRGRTVASNFQPVEGLDPALRVMLGNLRTSLVSVPLPEQAIGVGARWEVRRTFDLEGLSVEQTLTYTLTGEQDEVAHLQVVLRQSAPPRDFENGSVSAYESTALGDVMLDVRRLVPYSQVEMTTRMRSTLRSGGSSNEVDVETRRNVRVQRTEQTTTAPAAN